VLIELTGDGERAAAMIGKAIARLEERALAELDAAAVGGLRAGLAALAEATP